MVKKSAVSKYLAKIGRRGGKARLETMTPEERAAIARKGAEAANKVKAAKKASAAEPRTASMKTRGRAK